MKQVSLTQPGMSIDEQWVVLSITWCICNSERCSMGKLVGLTDYEIVECLLWADAWDCIYRASCTLLARERRGSIAPRDMKLNGDRMANDLLGKTDGDLTPPDWVVDPTAAPVFADMLLDCIAVFEELGECP